MPKTAMIRARIEPSVKEAVEEIFEHLGLNTTEAINLFYYQVILHKGLPFDITVPNKATFTIDKKTKLEQLFNKISKKNIFRDIKDPIEWQRNLRSEWE